MIICTRSRFAASAGVAALMVALTAPAYPATASRAEHSRMATAIANEIRDNGEGVFSTKNVELGPVVIERPWAIGDWRSGDGHFKGQVLFHHLCDSGNVAGVIAGTFSADKLVAHGAPSDKAIQLLADLSQSERDVAYTKVGPPGVSC